MYVNIVTYNYYYLYGQRYKKKRKKKLEEKSTAAPISTAFSLTLLRATKFSH